METFGEFIRRYRIEKKLTLTQLAAKLDMDSANLSKVENGWRDFDERRLDKLAQGLGIDPDQLKSEYYSELIAKKIYLIDHCHSTLILAERKVGYFREKITKQGSLNF